MPGALQVLQREGIVQLLDPAPGHEASYVFRVRKSLPLLRPEQVSRLSPALQRDHARFLARAEAVRKKPGALDSSADDRGTWPDDLDTDDAAGGGTNNNYQEDQVTTDDRWEEVARELSLQLDPAVWSRLIGPTEAHLDQEGEVLTITSRDRYNLDFLEHRFAAMVRRAVRQVYGRELELRFEWREEAEGQ